MNSVVKILESEKQPHTVLTQVPRKTALVLSTPRTGSIFVSEVIFAHFEATFPRSQHLGEFLNPYHYNLFFEDLPDGTRLNHHEYASGRYRIIPGINKAGRIVWAHAPFNEKTNDLEEETMRRLGLLGKATTSYILHHHVFTSSLVEEVLKANAFDLIVVCRRKNVWDQILSYGVAYHTKKFKYVKGNEVTLGAHSVVLDKRVFDTLVFRIKEMNKVLPMLAEKATILWYEDVEMMSKMQLLSKLGLPNVISSNVSKLSVKTPYTLALESYYDKQNLRDMTVWYNHEFA